MASAKQQGKGKDGVEEAVMGKVTMEALRTMMSSCGDGGLLLKGFKKGNGSQEWGMNLKITKSATEKLCRRLSQ